MFDLDILGHVMCHIRRGIAFTLALEEYEYRIKIGTWDFGTCKNNDILEAASEY